MNFIKLLKFLKTGFALLLCMLLCASFINRDFDTAINEEKTYFKFSVSGNQINNTFSILGDQNNSSQNVTAMIFPDGNSGEYKMAELAYGDIIQETSAYFKIPAKSGLIELKEGNPKYSFSITIGDINLKAQSVSVNTEEVVIDNMMRMKASYAKGSFEGVFIHEYIENSETFKVPYLVSGNFQFMSPRYKPKK